MQTVLGKYEIRAKISKGPMSTVYDGWDTAIDRRVAIKAVPLAQTGQLEGWQHLARFRREAQAAGRLQHPNVVAIFDYGETSESAFIIMEFVEGGTLKSALEAGKRFSIVEIVKLMQDILEGLQYSHDRGIVHRDIKPANVMLTNDGHAKIADFGIARVEHSDITQVGMIMGTPAYMSPEQFRGEPISASTDLYSAGVILYQLLTGERPFDGGLATIMHKALSTEPPKPSDISKTAPRSVDEVVARAMAKQPEQRFDDAKGFAQALQDALAVKQRAHALRLMAAQKVHGPLRRATAPSYLHLGAGALLLTLAAAGGIAGYWMLTPRIAPKTEENLQRPIPALPPAAALPSPPKPASQAEPAAFPANPDLARPGPLPPPAPVDRPSEPFPAPTEALAIPPISPVIAPLRAVPGLSGRDPTAAPLIYPTPQPLPRVPHKDAAKPPARSVVRVPTEPKGAGDARAGPRSKDAPDELDPAKPPGNDAPTASQRRLSQQDKNVAPARSPAPERDNPPPTPPPEIVPPRIMGTFGFVNGLRTYIPAPEPAK